MRRLFPLIALALVASDGWAQDLLIREWLVLGPLPADTGRSGVVRDYLRAEGTVLPDLGLAIGGGTFEPIQADSLGRVDLNTVAGPSDWSVAYVHTYVHAPSERSVQLVMDSDDDLVAHVNGQRVWVHVVPRGIGLGADTVRVRLAAGWNSVLLKVINRTGGFGALGRLASVPGGAVTDLTLATARPPEMTAHNLPAVTVEVGPLRVTDRPRWRGHRIVVAGRLPVTVWGPDALTDLEIQARPTDESWPPLQVDSVSPGQPWYFDRGAFLSTLRDAAGAGRPLSFQARWAGGQLDGTLAVDPDAVLRLVDDRIAIFDTRDTIPTPAQLHADLVVPAFFSGSSLDLYTVGLGPATRYRVNGTERAPASGRLTLCAPCAAGDSLVIDIFPDSARPLWMTPYARVRESGYVAYADGYRYARALTGTTPPIAAPDAGEWLRALGTPAYLDLRARYATAFAPLSDRMRGDTLQLIGNSHIDAAWLWRWEHTIDLIRRTWRTSLKLAEIFPGYIFAGSAAAYYDAMDRIEPTLADSLAQATAEGSWVPVGGWWVEADMNIPAGESLIRQGLYGQRYFQRRFGRRSRVAWTPDTFGYPWTVPQILRGTGFDYFVTQKIRWNDSTEFPHNAFQWEGRDGTRIFSYNPYGYVHNLDAQRLVEERVEDAARTGGRHLIVLYGVGDRGGGPTIAMLERAENLRRVPTFPTMQYAAPLPALEAVANGRPADAFPIWRDELYLEYHRGTYTSQAAIKRRHRESEVRLQTAEALAAVDTSPYPRDALERAWRLVLFNQFHDILPGSGIDSIYPDAHAFYDTAWAELEPIVNDGFARLRGRMDTRGDGPTLVVFNPLGWARSGVVTDPASGESRYVADVPSLGAVVVRGREVGGTVAAPTAGPGWMENAYLRIEIDTLTGNVVRLFDKERRREVLVPGGTANALQVLDDRPQQWDAWNVMPNPETWDVTDVTAAEFRSDRRAARYVIEREWGASTFQQTLVLDRHSRMLVVENAVEWHERRKLLKVAFGFDVAADSATYEIPYGTIGRSGHPRTQAERAKFEVPGQRWADVSADGYGVSILNDSKYGWDYRHGTLRLSLLKAPIWPDSTADRGRHAFRYAIYPHAGDWRAAGTDRIAAEFNVPMLGAQEPAHRGPLGRSTSFAWIDVANAQIAWLKRAEDSDALVLRIVEWHGVGGNATVTVGCDIDAVSRANMLEDAEGAIPFDGRRVTFSLRPYEITTLLVTCSH